MRRVILCGTLALELVAMTGCTLLHELQPHRLWRLNRQPAPTSSANFSVSDPLPADAHAVLRDPAALAEPAAQSVAGTHTSFNRSQQPLGTLAVE
jgi:hypothetical protein